jgi:hypothetical protein
MKLVGNFRYRGVPTAIYLTQEEWFKGYCATHYNGIEVEWAEIYLGTKDAPSALHVAIVLLHELGHLAEKITWTPMEQKKELAMVFKERLYGMTQDVLKWYLDRELVAWSFAYALVKHWNIPEEIFNETVKKCTGKAFHLVIKLVKKITEVVSNGKGEDNIHQ